MGMLTAGIDFQIAELLARHRATRQHPLYRHFNKTLGKLAFQHLLKVSKI